MPLHRIPEHRRRRAAGRRAGREAQRRTDGHPVHRRARPPGRGPPADHRQRPLHRRHRRRHRHARGGVRPVRRTRTPGSSTSTSPTRWTSRAWWRSTPTRTWTGAAAEPLPVLIPHPALHAPPHRLRAGQRRRQPRRRADRHGGRREPLPGRGCRRPDRRRLRRCCRPWSASRAARAAKHAVHEDMPDNVAAHLVQQVGDVDAGDGRRAAPAGLRPGDRTVVLDAAGGQGGARPLGPRRPQPAGVLLAPRRRPRCGPRSPPSSGLPLPKVEVIAPDVGGGFGVKIMHPWPEEILVPMAAMRLRPAGEMDRGPPRAFHLLRARTRPGAAHHASDSTTTEGFSRST